MTVPELFGGREPVFSFEFFLPKAPEDLAGFMTGVRELKSLNPSFVTLTYGAGGSGREKTIETAGRIQSELGIKTASHLTCIAHTKAEIAAILTRLRALDITTIVALRGDPPKGVEVPPPGKRDFGYARDLVAYIRERGGFQLAVAGYPEGHPESPSREADLARLKEKVDAGGDWIVTQLFFDNRDYFDFVRRCRQADIDVPIVPGIMPVTGYAQLKRFTAMCGAKLPPSLVALLEPIQDQPEAVIRCGIEYATRQCRELLSGGAPGIHFYTLNRTRSTSEILGNLRRGS